jgi:prepilin-type N-terminal cleavage/methylation domain-containing protein
VRPRGGRNQRRTRDDAGFTLVELMVGIIAAGLVAAGTFTFFAGQQRVYEIQTKMLGVQENLWAAQETVTRYVRASGAGMNDCVRLDSDGAGIDTGDPAPGGPSAPQTGLRAFRAGVGALRIAPLWIHNGVAGTPDTITVAYGRGATGNFRDAFLGTTLLTGQSTSAEVTTMPGQTVRFVPGEFVLLVHEARSDGDRGCSLFRITEIVPLTNTLAHAVTSPWNATADSVAIVPFDYPGGAASMGGVRNFGELVWVQLAINNPGGGVAPSLTMDRLDDDQPAQLLAEGIEDMQVAYACDASALGVADGIITEGADPGSRLADDWTYNEPGDIEPARCQRPDAVRITLVARTLTPDPTLADASGNARPATEDAAAAPADLFRHRAVTATVRLRN